VVVKNTSSLPQRIWQEWNSWGYYCLSFELTDATGKRWIAAKRRDVGWSRNFPRSLTIDPGGIVVIDVPFGDDGPWEGFPLKKGQQATVKIHAIYEVPESPESTELSVWVGRVESNPVEVTFVRWK
jgi:hypothetical protein